MTTLFPATFVGGTEGSWLVERIDRVVGDALPRATRLDIREGVLDLPSDGWWALRGVGGHPRYVQRTEQEALARIQPGLGRPAATRAALIPIRKSAEWWNLAQDERR